MKQPKKPIRRKKSPPFLKVAKWVAAIGVVGLIGYAVTQNGGVAYGEDALTAINFSELKADEKHNALKAANDARCGCGCGLTLAQCVATDSTCPIREANIDRIKTMVKDAHHP
jgi:hypothetical protein